MPKLIFNLKTEHYPFFVRAKLNTLKMKKIDVWIEGTDNISADIKVTSGNLAADVHIDKAAAYDDIPHASISVGNVNPTGDIQIIINTPNVLDKIQNIYFLIQS